MISLELSDDNIKTLTKTMGGGSQIAKDFKNLAKIPGATSNAQRQRATAGAWLAQDMQRGRGRACARVPLYGGAVRRRGAVRRCT